MVQDLLLNIKGKSKIVIAESQKLLPDYLAGKPRVVVISDLNIDRLYGEMLAPYEKILIGVGESVKTLQTVETICRRLIELNADRSTFLLGIGGGIVSDITGFVAGIYMRGINFGFVSTTLLSQVDAGVGGKNGVNFDGFKNMIGTFLQPEFVICDVAMLSTLPEREFRAGLAEIIKSAIIANSELFNELELHTLESLRVNKPLLSRIIFESVKIKARIVEMDEREAGERRKLNLGHTFAHAIEKNSNVMNHGEAVAAGMVIIADMAHRMGMLKEADLYRINKIIESYGFVMESPVPMSKMLKSIMHDKKAHGDTVGLVLPTAIGDCEVKKMTLNEITEFQLS
ncbi:MAG: 3-dehydroquinate synthase [Rikenellaceae bacterium]